MKRVTFYSRTLLEFKKIVFLPSLFALVAELVDALDSKSSSFGSVGSIPTQGTKLQQKCWSFIFL
tara:strand:+ start:137 stop:331 length:195 start_codon:yes stop_codon:yes gene_type:complete